VTDSRDPTFDLRHAQGTQMNFGSGNIQINANDVSSLAEDCYTMANFNLAGAYALFERRSRRRKEQLLAVSDRAVEMFRRHYRQHGPDRSHILLAPLEVRRIRHLLTGLDPKERLLVLDRIARTLARQDNVADARAHVAGWAEIAPSVAADLIRRVHALRPGEARRVGLRGAIELMPEGPDFLIIVPPAVGSALLDRLLPTPFPRGGGLRNIAATADIDLLLGDLVTRDPVGTARLAAELDPQQVSWYLRRLRLHAATSLLAHLLATAEPEQRNVVLGSLPRYLGTALVTGAGAAGPESARPLPTTGWPRVDAVAAVFSFAGPALSRSFHGQTRLSTAVLREASDARLVWRSVRHAANDRDHLRRQRTRLLLLVAGLTIALVVATAFAS
jgi:hypothetical protein